MYLLSLYEVSGGVNCTIARASATEIIRWKNSNWLVCNGGHTCLQRLDMFCLQRIGADTCRRE